MRLIDADKFMDVLNICKQANQQRPLSEEKLNDKAVNNYETGQKETFDLVMEQLERQPNVCGSNDVLMDESKIFDACATLEGIDTSVHSDDIPDSLRIFAVLGKVKIAVKLLNDALKNSKKC